MPSNKFGRRFSLFLIFVLSVGLSFLLALPGSHAVDVASVPNPRQTNVWVTDISDLAAFSISDFR